jgi:hypothetical protein
MHNSSETPDTRQIMQAASQAFSNRQWERCARLIDACRETLWLQSTASVARPQEEEGSSDRLGRIQNTEALWQAMPAGARKRVGGDSRHPLAGLATLSAAGYTVEGQACVPLSAYAAAMGMRPEEAMTALKDTGRLIPQDRVLSVH